MARGQCRQLGCRRQEVSAGFCRHHTKPGDEKKKRVAPDYLATMRQVKDKSTILLGFVCFVALFAVPIGLDVLLLGSVWWYTKTTLLFILLPYYSYILVLGRQERRDGQAWPWFCRRFWLFRPARRFLDMKIVMDPELEKAAMKDNSQFFFAINPHGTNADYRILLQGMLMDELGETVGGNLRVLAATVLFRIPLVREVALWTGCVDASRSVADSLLEKGYSLMVIPGGQMEQMHTVAGREIVYLKQRLGFVKLALRHKVPLVPVYVFGASDYYTTSSLWKNMRLSLVKNWGIAIPLCRGFLGLPLCPKPIATTIVVGPPLALTSQNNSSPTKQDIETAHKIYCQALEKLFDDHKVRLGYGDRRLEIV